MWKFQKIQFKNKDKRDMYRVANYMLQGGVKQSVLKAIRENLGLENPKVLDSISKSLTKSFEQMRQEAIHVNFTEPYRSSKILNLDMKL